MFEHRSSRLLSRAEFVGRMLRHTGIGLGILSVSLGIGVLGYRGLEGQSWVDSLLNASMLLGGMGPVGELHTTAGKLFASAYALFSGTVFLVAVGVMFAPMFHRIMHKFHLATEEDEQEEDEGKGKGKKA